MLGFDIILISWFGCFNPSAAYELRCFWIEVCSFSNFGAIAAGSKKLMAKYVRLSGRGVAKEFVGCCFSWDRRFPRCYFGWNLKDFNFFDLLQNLRFMPWIQLSFRLDCRSLAQADVDLLEQMERLSDLAVGCGGHNPVGSTKCWFAFSFCESRSQYYSGFCYEDF